MSNHPSTTLVDNVDQMRPMRWGSTNTMIPAFDHLALHIGIVHQDCSRTSINNISLVKTDGLASKYWKVAFAKMVSSKNCLYTRSIYRTTTGYIDCIDMRMTSISMMRILMITIRLNECTRIDFNSCEAKLIQIGYPTVVELSKGFSFKLALCGILF